MSDWFSKEYSIWGQNILTTNVKHLFNKVPLFSCFFPLNSIDQLKFTENIKIQKLNASLEHWIWTPLFLVLFGDFIANQDYSKSSWQIRCTSLILPSSSTLVLLYVSFLDFCGNKENKEWKKLKHWSVLVLS